MLKERGAEAVQDLPEGADGMVRLSRDLHKRLKIEAAKRSISMKEALEEAAEVWLKSKKAGAA